MFCWGYHLFTHYPRLLPFPPFVLCRRAMLRLSAVQGDALSENKMRVAFDKVDKDKNGNLDVKELLEALRSFESDLNEASVPVCF